MELATLFAFFSYFSILIGIGFFAYRRQRTSEEFLLGGRSLNFWVTAFSAHASDMSNWLFMGFPAAIFTFGLLECWTAFGLLSGMFLSWQFIAPRLRTVTEQYNVLTISSYFAKRFDDRSGIIRLVTALMSLLFFTFYITAGLRGMGIVIATAFPLDYHAGITISTLFVLTYTVIGGFTAVAYNDMFQALFLITMIILVPCYAFTTLDGYHIIKTIAQLKQIPLVLLPDYSFASVLTGLTIATGWGLGYFGQPHILNKFMSIRNVHDMKKAQLVGMTWQTITLVAATAVGVIGIGFFPDGLVNSELIFIVMVKQLFAPFFAGIILCAILAAIISTIDSQALVFASVVSEDVYKPFINVDAKGKELVWISRASIIFVCSLAYVIAFFEVRSVYALVKYSWSGLGSSFGPLLLTSLYTKRITHAGALAGIITGGTIAALWPHTSFLFNNYPMIPGFLASIAALLGVSLITKK